MNETSHSNDDLIIKHTFYHQFAKSAIWRIACELWLHLARRVLSRAAAMSASLTSHLEQISLCAQSISELPFPGPRRFTNAILAKHDITALLRDTQAHERALFHLAPSDTASEIRDRNTGLSAAPNAPHRRASVHKTRPAKNKAVAAVLGGDLYQRIQQQPDGRGRGEADVEILLHGAEKLAAVYPVAGVADRISHLRRRHQQLAANIAHYEARANEQRQELDKMNITTIGTLSTTDDMDLDEAAEKARSLHSIDAADEDWYTMQDEIDELEQKKRKLEARVQGIDKDLGGLLG